MNFSSTCRLLVLAVLIAASMPAQPLPQTATADTITKTINAAVSDASHAAYAICELEAAVWGNYTATVTMPNTSTTSNQTLVFQVSNGVLTQAVSATPWPASFPGTTRTGNVFLPDRAAAFAKGVPFWIGDVSFTGTGLTVQYTVYSNPAIVAFAQADFETIIPASNNPQGNFGLDVNLLYQRLSSTSQPQTYVGGVCDPSFCGPFSAINQNYLSAQAGTSPLRCPSSNYVDLYAVSVLTPTIRHLLPVLQAFDNNGAISSGSWIQIFGDKLSTTTRSWRTDDFHGNLAPTSLDGVRVNVNGKPAFVSYVSPNQVNAQAPDDDTVGLVSVEVINGAGPSNKITVQKNVTSPALLTTPSFLVDGKHYAAALLPDFTTFVAPQNAIAGVVSRPAKPGETIVVFAVGCGLTQPTTLAGETLSEARPLSMPYTIHFGTSVADAQGYLVKGSVGLCQFNVTVPDLPDGDAMMMATVGGVNATPLYLAVHH